MSATFLVTGFEPFGEHRTNSSWDALVGLAATLPPNIVTRRLPVDHRAAHQVLRQALIELRPRAVLCTGLAKGSVFRIEMRARRPIELDDERGAAEHSGRWPWSEMQSALQDSGVAAVSSEDAGRYVCESTYWSLLNYSGPAPIPEFAAFLHVPPESDEHGLERIGAAIGRVVDARYRALASDPGALAARFPPGPTLGSREVL